ncbi:MAG TPA: acetate--CoA ligase family protein [Actinomycetota bacterium]|nr:acetate--CoA ligase family protein [Actinomycetota bacterium]
MTPASSQASPDGRSAIERMLEARSVAVVGASVKEGSVGNQAIVELVEGGFEGRIFPVNPKYDEVLGHRAFGSVAEIGEPVDLAILAVSNALLEEQLSAAASAGAGSAVIFASGYEESRDGVPPLTERLAAIAREAGMAICGGNCMGFVNLGRRVRALGFYEPKDAPVGGVTFLSHSGSAFSAMIHNDRNLGLNLAVSAGQEYVTTVADYLRYALGLDSTKAVGLFLETVRDPDGFRSALELAAERDVPVVALKVGREARTRELVAAHSGALAGEDGAYEALFEAFGVSRVESLDEMADTLALFAAGRRAGPGALASVHDSGGERALLIDSAAAVSVPLAEISDETTQAMEALLEPGLPPVNPLDFWGTGTNAHEIVTGCVRALLDDPAVAALAFSVDLTTEDYPDMGYLAMARETFPETDKPFAMLSNFSSGIDRNDAKLLEGDGIPVLEGTLTGIAAFKHLFAYRDFRDREPITGSSPASDDVRKRWKARLSSGEPFDELEGLALLADYDIPVVESVRADTLEDAIAAADRLGFPVAVKTAAPGVQHKSDVGGVRLGVDDSPSLEDAYGDLERELGPQVTVSKMAPAGVEIALGIVNDPQFGPLVLVGAGGVLVEVLKDRRLALPPLDQARVGGLVDRLEIRPLLDGARGQPAADVEALIRVIVALSWLGHDLGEHLEALDANPVICGPKGSVAVDALVIARA